MQSVKLMSHSLGKEWKARAQMAANGGDAVELVAHGEFEMMRKIA